MVIRIRNASPEDVAFIKEMMWEAILVSPVQVRGYGLEKMRSDQENYWNRWLEKPSPVFVAEDEAGQKLGVLTLRGHEDFRRDERATGWEMGMGVAPHARRQGVGQSLIRHALDFCRETKVPFLVLTVDPSNRNAFALSRKMGFKITSKRHYVIEMPVSFEPPLLEGPEIVTKR